MIDLENAGTVQVSAFSFTEALMGADLILIPTVNTKAEPSEILLVLFLIKLNMESKNE